MLGEVIKNSAVLHHAAENLRPWFTFTRSEQVKVTLAHGELPGQCRPCASPAQTQGEQFRLEHFVTLVLDEALSSHGNTPVY